MDDVNSGSRGLAPEWLRAYRREWLASDAVAGVTTAAVVVPKALAFATIAGLPLQAGLATAFVPGVLYTLLGSSRPMSMSTTTTIAILTAAEISRLAPEGSGVSALAVGATLSVLVGVILLLARVLRLGAVANLISDPVLTGFKAGLGLVIIVDQVPKLLGFHITKTGFFRDVIAIVRHVGDAHVPTLLVGCGLLALIFLLEWVAPRLPAPLVAVAVGIAASSVLGLAARGVSTVGNVPAGFPPFTAPVPSLAEELWPGAVGIALMSFIETVAIGRAFRRSGERQPDADGELVALGAANVVGGLFGGMPAGGGTSQSAVSDKAGAKSPLCGAVASLGALATLLFLAPALGLMPSAALAAVVVATSIPLIKPADFRAIARIRRTELVWALAATAGVMVLGTLKGILVAVVVSVVALAAQAVRPPIYAVGRKRGTPYFRHVSPEHPDDETFPGVLLVRIVGRLFFLNVKRATEELLALAEKEPSRIVVLDCSGLIDLEYTALKSLVETEETLRGRGVLFGMAAVNHQVRELVERSSLGAALGRERMFFNLEQAVERIPGLLAHADTLTPGTPRLRQNWRMAAEKRDRGGPGAALLLALLLSPAGQAQDTPPPADAKNVSLFRDASDGALDLSGWLATRTGVLPLAAPITEPAVGYGAAAAVVHFSGGGLAGAMTAPPGPSGRPIPPDVTVLGGGLTENGTWAVAAAYIGHWNEDRWRYKAAASRLAPTLDYYGASDRAFQFTMDGWMLYQELGVRVSGSDLFAGLRFLWFDSTVSFEAPRAHEGIPDPEFDAKDVGLGPFVEWDARDNTLTPSSGFNVKASAMFLGPWLGGDRAYERYTGLARFYWDPKPWLVLAARVQAQGVSGDAPFYALPFIQLRGIPAMRYQGDTAASLEGEVRWNIWKRWWLVGFAGAGKTTDAPGLSKDGEDVQAGGFGFRYLVARALGLQVGIDFAKGPEDEALYVIAGSSF